ncbi:MAG: Crp/Fnr family transcriptional regulator [Flammeovirgaceae bacterium]
MGLHQLFVHINKTVPLNSDEEKTITSKATVRKFLKGQFLVQQGDVCKHESFVLSGCLKTFYTDAEGQEHIVMFAIENWWTADLGSFITQTPARYNVQCLDNTEVVQLSFEALEELYQKVPKLERFFRIIIQRAFASSWHRITDLHSIPAKERYLKFREQYPAIEQRVPQYMIASYLGITKEFLSKIRNQLALD